jgi:hypothetical protein
MTGMDERQKSLEFQANFFFLSVRDSHEELYAELGHSSVVQHLPHMCRALGSITSTEKNFFNELYEKDCALERKLSTDGTSRSLGMRTLETEINEKAISMRQMTTVH